MVSAKNIRGETIRIGMAHIDNTVPLDGIRKFFDQFSSEIGNAKITTSVISGEKTTALNTLQVIDERGYSIDFFNADLDGQRRDAALIDDAGKIYYGRKDVHTTCAYGGSSLMDGMTQNQCEFRMLAAPKNYSDGNLDIQIFNNSQPL